MKPFLFVRILGFLFVAVLVQESGGADSGKFPHQGEAIPPEHLMHASASYSDGLLQIRIPFFNDPKTQFLFGPNFEWFGIRFRSPNEGNPVGWISYRDPDGKIIHSGPLRAESSTQSRWYYDFMPSRVEKVDPFGPMFSTGAPTAAGFLGLQGLLGDTYPTGVMKIVLFGEVFEEDPDTPAEIGVSCCQNPWIVRLPFSTDYQQYLNYIAFGQAGSVLVNQILVTTNLGSKACSLLMELFDRDGDALEKLAMEVPGNSIVHHSLIDIYTQQALAGTPEENPPLFLGSARITSVTDTQTEEVDPKGEFVLGTVYQILQMNGSSQSELLGEAGLAVAQPSCFNLVPVRRTSSGEDTGLAMGCPSPVGSHRITMSLIDENQKEVAYTDDLFLQPFGIDSRFFWEYFDTMPAAMDDFSGSVRITSSAGISVTALNTLNGYVVSSLPAGISDP
jgi:hypothetical protein